MKVLSKVWIVSDGGKILFGEGRLRMLELVQQCGSMNKAAAEMGMSFRTLWGKLRATEKEMGTALVEPRAGGGRRGGSALTADATRLMGRFRSVNAKVTAEADAAFSKAFGEKSGAGRRG